VSASERHVGRNARLSKKRYDGAAATTALWAGVYGDAAGTEGAFFASMILNAPQGTEPKFVKPRSPEQAHGKFEEAILAFDSKFFRDVADYLDAKKKVVKSGVADSVFAEVALYVSACTSDEFRRHFGQPRFAKPIGLRRHLLTALASPPHTPTVAEIYDHLCEAFADPPSYKTAERHARTLGISPKK
jgi:hypothetical protein